MTINTAALPQNILTAIHKFEEAKDEYEQHQKRLGQLSKRLEKHRKAAEATQAQSTQLGTQWRDAFRQNDGELTKEIRALKTQEVEAREMAEEYNNLVAELTPEFERCQIETVKARKNHVGSLTDLKKIYADYTFTQSAVRLFSLPEAKPFLASLNHKLKAIDHHLKTTEPYSRMPDDKEVAEVQLRMEGELILGAIQKFLDAKKTDNVQESGFQQYSELEKLDIELTSYSPARAQRLMKSAESAST